MEHYQENMALKKVHQRRKQSERIDRRKLEKEMKLRNELERLQKTKKTKKTQKRITEIKEELNKF